MVSRWMLRAKWNINNNDDWKWEVFIGGRVGNTFIDFTSVFFIEKIVGAEKKMKTSVRKHKISLNFEENRLN